MRSMERELVKLESMVPALKNKENEMVSWDFNIENKGIEFFAKPQIFLSEYIFNLDGVAFDISNLDNLIE